MNKPTLITLSFSTINNCLQESNNHAWLCKQMGIKVPDRSYFTEGKDCHRIIQDHVSGVSEFDLLRHIPIKFDVVEKIEKDPDTHFTLKINDKYAVHGYYDGRDDGFTKLLEIKSSSSLWTLGQFQKSMQRKIYALSDERIAESWLITCKRDPKLWKLYPPKYFKIPVSDQDKADAIKFIMNGIEVIEKGNFSGGLDSEGRCSNPRCLYGENCFFRR
jgi:hypothetical protein